MINEKFIPYAQQHISPEDIAAVSEALQRPQITRGALVEEFEQAIETYPKQSPCRIEMWQDTTWDSK